jgi:hypothetical protein
MLRIAPMLTVIFAWQICYANTISVVNTETIKTTAEHPFYVEGQGWVGAADLQVGWKVLTADGKSSTVVSNEVQVQPAPLAVYNFSVEGDHTYFVEDGAGLQDPIWVHNACNPNAIETMHLLPRASEFADKWKRLGINIERYTIRMRTADHRLLPNGLHTGPNNWNAQWRQFFNEYKLADESMVLDKLLNSN